MSLSLSLFFPNTSMLVLLITPAPCCQNQADPSDSLALFSLSFLSVSVSLALCLSLSLFCVSFVLTIFLSQITFPLSTVTGAASGNEQYLVPLLLPPNPSTRYSNPMAVLKKVIRKREDKHFH